MVGGERMRRKEGEGCGRGTEGGEKRARRGKEGEGRGRQVFAGKRKCMRERREAVGGGGRKRVGREASKRGRRKAGWLEERTAEGS